MTLQTRAQLWTGRAQLPPRPLELRAGPVRALLDGADLRHVRLGPVELVERVYVAVRDAPWNTIPARYDRWVLRLEDDHFEVSFRAVHAHDDIRFTWDGTISGTTDGVIRYRMDGRCEGVFAYSKIGFNVHHAQRDSVGRRFRAQTSDGELTGVLPERIDPQRVVDGKLSGMFPPYSEVAIEVADGIEAVVGLEGDLLEMQDHRNWIDANFKSYGTPLALGFPFESRSGQTIAQALTISHAGRAALPDESPDPVATITDEPTGRLPAIGFGQASHGRALADRAVERLRLTRPRHLRVDLHLRTSDHLAAVELAAADATRVGCGLELAIYLSEPDGDALAELALRLRGLDVGVERVLVYAGADGFSATAATTPAALVKLVRERLEPIAGDVVFAAGSDNSFVDLNRDPPTDEAISGLMFMVSPTVHAPDDGAIVENIAGIGEVVRMARTIGGARAICVGPITIATRNGPYPGGPAAPGDLPPPVDPRQLSLLGAAWTVGALAELAASGADTATFYETTGWRGLLEQEDGSPMPEHFPSLPGQAFPLFHVFADLAEWTGEHGAPLEFTTSDPQRVVGMAARHAGGVGALVANVTPEPQRVLVRGLADQTRCRLLDDSTAPLATSDPEAFRSYAGALLPVRAGAAWLALGPYAVARLDLAT